MRYIYKLILKTNIYKSNGEENIRLNNKNSLIFNLKLKNKIIHENIPIQQVNEENYLNMIKFIVYA